MPWESAFMVCRHCRRWAAHQRRTPNWGLHILLLFFTGGAWLLVVVPLALCHNIWWCTACGRYRRRSAAPYVVFVLALLLMVLLAMLVWRRFL